MLFCISTSFAEKVATEDRNCIDALIRIIDSRKRGLLLLYFSSKTSDILSKYFDSLNDSHNSKLIRTIYSKFRQKKELLKSLTTFVLITEKIPSTYPRRKGKIIITNANFINNSNLLYPPILLGENLTDCEFYANKITKNFSNGLHENLTSLKISERFEPGGGNSTHTSYKRHKEKRLDLCLCIVDSDRKHPKEGLGDTAKFVLEVDEKDQSSICRNLVIDMYSAENLLPISEIERQFVIDKNEKQIKDFEITKKIREMDCWKHLPLKKGLRGKDLKSNGEKENYWIEKLKHAGIIFPCCDIDDCPCSLVPKIHERTLAVAVSNTDVE